MLDPDKIKAPEPWFYRKRVFLSVLVWPANLRGFLWLLVGFLASMAAGHYWWPAFAIGMATVVVVSWAKSGDVPPDW